MKIELSSAPVRNRDIGFNLRSMGKAIREASGKADLILFGESVLQGFDCLCWDYEQDRKMAVTLEDEPVLRLREMAADYKIALSFGFIQRSVEILYSSQLTFGPEGQILDLFHRVSPGWKESDKTDGHYREGTGFHSFSYCGKTFACGLCGDLWTAGRPEELKALNADAILWPVWCDYPSADWNGPVKQEYAAQAALCGETVLFVNPYCADPDAPDAASGGSACFQAGSILSERPAGAPGTLFLEI